MTTTGAPDGRNVKHHPNRNLSEHIRGLEQMRGELERLVHKAMTLPGPNAGTFCHIIELARPPDRERRVPSTIAH